MTTMAKRIDPSDSPSGTPSGEGGRYDLSGDEVIRPGRGADRSREPYGYDPSRDTGLPSGPLDMSQDPDRYDPTRTSAAPSGPLDMSKDPDRYDPIRDALGVPRKDNDPDRPRRPGSGQTLPGLLGEGAQEDERDNAQWALGLLAMVVFLLLMTFLLGGF